MVRSTGFRISAALALTAVAVMGVSGSSATADQGQPVIAGQTNTATAATVIHNTTADDTGVIGQGLLTGVEGQGNGFAGVVGEGGPSGVYGLGQNGVVGQAKSDGDGVEGHANNSAASGVYGQNDGSGFGVAGRANNGGIGVLGDSVSGVGVKAYSPSGTALLVDGKAQFSRSGTKVVPGTISVPKSSVTITGVALSGRSFIIATPQKNIAGVWVQAAVPVPYYASIVIYLNKAVTQSYPVGWMVIEHP